METPQVKAQNVLWLAELKSVVLVQREFQRMYHRDPPVDRTIREWYKKFQDTSSVLPTKHTGQPGTSEDDVERIRHYFLHSPKTFETMQLGTAHSA
jgi:hypothetical protein